ncbi:MAG: hypothetical protein ACRDRK_03700 [Pseudonocardia sp.]
MNRTTALRELLVPIRRRLIGTPAPFMATARVRPVMDAESRGELDDVLLDELRSVHLCTT